MDVMFDPVASDLVVAGEDGFPVLEARTRQVHVKHYQDSGILYLRLEGQDAQLSFVTEDDRLAELALLAGPEGWWRVQVLPLEV